LIGVITSDDLQQATDQVKAIILPPPGKQNGRSSGGDTQSGGIPTDPSHAGCICDTNYDPTPRIVNEIELSNNPQIFTEDPGSFCKPFSNPERILTERSFYSILRVEQPEISASASSGISLPILWDYNPTHTVRAMEVQPPTSAAPIHFNPGVLKLPAFLNGIAEMDNGRHEMSARYPIQWEGDSLRYQATTVAAGHVLEFRLRTRSNGYSLGSVAKTLTLAPRQTKRWSYLFHPPSASS
jgi:hypothetical protein